MNEEQEKILNEIHKLATGDDHLLVPFNQDQLKMANSVIVKLEAKLNQIADLVQVVCGD